MRVADAELVADVEQRFELRARDGVKRDHRARVTHDAVAFVERGYAERRQAARVGCFGDRRCVAGRAQQLDNADCVALDRDDERRATEAGATRQESGAARARRAATYASLTATLAPAASRARTASRASKHVAWV